MKTLFINGSPNKDGKTAKLTAELLKGHDYETLNLTDYVIGCYGQELEDDQLDEVVAKMEEAQLIVVGSPVYWHNMCGSVRNLLDRLYGVLQRGCYEGKKLAFVFQGGAPEKWMLDAGDYSMNRFALIYGMEYLGMIGDKESADKINKTL